jgi:integrase
MVSNKIEVSDGSVTKYEVSKGVRWRWQAVATERVEDLATNPVRLGKAGFATRKEAREAMRESLHHIKKEGFPQSEVIPVAVKTFGEVAAEWSESLDLANSTISGYTKIIRNHLDPYLGDKGVLDLATGDLNSLYSLLLGKGRKDSKHPGGSLKGNTVNKCHQVVRSILDYAVTHEFIPYNVARSPKLSVPSARSMLSQKTEIEVWTIAETKALLEWNECVYNDDLHVLWRLLAMTGLRRGEGVALQWKDIDFANSKLKVVRAADSAKSKATKSTKTYRQRSLDIDPETLAYLEGHMAQRRQLGLEYVAPSAFIFGTIANELRGPNDVTRRFSKMVKKAQQSVISGQLPWVTLQGLRHGHATHLLEAAIQPKIVQERLGHSNIQTTMDIYSHVLPTIQRDALSVLMTKWAESN